jgi:hypothetical protein
MSACCKRELEKDDEESMKNLTLEKDNEESMKNPTTDNSTPDSKLVAMHVAILTNEISNILFIININFEIKLVYEILCC